jgi:hypothetical protein
MRKLFISTIALMALTLSGNAQIKTPAPSPLGKVSQMIGLTEVKVAYSRPSVKGRAIFGELVPFDQLWRTGANAATTIKFEDKINIGGVDVAPGKYSVFTIPGAVEWTFILNKDAKAQTGSYSQEKDVLRYKVKSTSLPVQVETFTIGFEAVKENSAVLRLMWAQTAVDIPIVTEVDNQVMKAIDKTLAGPSAGDYYTAARYYFDNAKDINKAHEWINKAVEMGKDEPKFWVIYRQALIKEKVGDTKGALAAAEASKALAIKADYAEYVKMNDEIIARLGGKGKKK